MDSCLFYFSFKSDAFDLIMYFRGVHMPVAFYVL